MKKKDILFGAIVFLVIVTIVGIMGMNVNSADDEILKCISEQSKLYVSKTCSHCAAQKQILGNGLKYFTLIDCGDNPLECIGITAVPTWEINSERSSGVKSIKELQELTGC